MKKLFLFAIGLTLLVQAILVSTASAQPKTFAQGVNRNHLSLNNGIDRDFRAADA